MVQDEYRQLYKKIRKNWKDSVTIYKEFVSQNITSGSIVLEAGCGFSNLFIEEYKRARQVIGVDVNEEFLRLNPCLDTKIVSNLEHIPRIENNSIDLIISSWVFEHLKHPQKVFCEFHRVLKKGGRVIFLTPNSWNYIVLLNRVIPIWLRKFIVKRMNKELVTDPMKTFYRANSIRELEKLANRNNFRVQQILTNGDPTYVAVNKLFFYLGIIIEAFLSLPFCRNFRVHIIGILVRKP